MARVVTGPHGGARRPQRLEGHRVRAVAAAHRHTPGEQQPGDPRQSGAADTHEVDVTEPVRRRLEKTDVSGFLVFVGPDLVYAEVPEELRQKLFKAAMETPAHIAPFHFFRCALYDILDLKCTFVNYVEALW